MEELLVVEKRDAVMIHLKASMFSKTVRIVRAPLDDSGTELYL